MANDLIRYDLRVQDALRGVIRKVLTDAARDGLPGEHHFQLEFRTDAPGVRLSVEMRRRFPEKMTIILQYEFRELSVTEQAVEVVLFFNRVPERLLIPFDAITGFFDPSVDFGLRFDVRSEALPDAPPIPAKGPKLVQVKSGEAKPGELKSSDGEVARIFPRGAASEPKETAPSRQKGVETGDAANSSRQAGEAAATDAKPKSPVVAKDGDTKIISIDAFRRKP